MMYPLYLNFVIFFVLFDGIVCPVDPKSLARNFSFRNTSKFENVVLIRHHDKPEDNETFVNLDLYLKRYEDDTYYALFQNKNSDEEASEYHSEFVEDPSKEDPDQGNSDFQFVAEFLQGTSIEKTFHLIFLQDFYRKDMKNIVLSARSMYFETEIGRYTFGFSTQEEAERMDRDSAAVIG